MLDKNSKKILSLLKKYPNHRVSIGDLLTLNITRKEINESTDLLEKLGYIEIIGKNRYIQPLFKLK